MPKDNSIKTNDFEKEECVYTSLYNKLLKNQVKTDSKIQKVVNENFWNYI